jgi:hypothetical protein
MQDLLHKLEGFVHAASLDLNMGHHHVKLNPDAQKHCTIVISRCFPRTNDRAHAGSRLCSPPRRRRLNGFEKLILRPFV